MKGILLMVFATLLLWCGCKLDARYSADIAKYANQIIDRVGVIGERLAEKCGFMHYSGIAEAAPSSAAPILPLDHIYVPPDEETH